MALTTAQRNDNIDLRYYKTTVFGEAAASTTYQSLNITKEGFKVNKKTVKSAVLGTRQVNSITKIGEDISASLGLELTHAEAEFLFEAIMGSTFTTFTTTQTDIDFAAADQSINSTADFGAIVAGQWIKVAGSAANSGLWYVATKSSSSKLILSNGMTSAGVTMTVTLEAAGPSITVTGKHLTQGSTLNSYTFERQNTDNATYDVYNSVVFDELMIDLKGDALVTIEASGVGKVADLNNVATVSSGVTAAVTTAPFNATNNLIRIKEGSTVLTDEIISANIKIKANAALRNSLGNETPTGARQGMLEVSGDVEFYFKDDTRRQAFQAHTDTPLYFILKNSTPNYLIITLKRSYYMSMDNSADNQSADMPEKYSFEAAKDTTYLKTVTIDVL